MDMNIVMVGSVRFIQHPVQLDDVGLFTTDGYYFRDAASERIRMKGPYRSRTEAALAKLLEAAGDDGTAVSSGQLLDFVLDWTDAKGAALALIERPDGNDAFVHVLRRGSDKAAALAKRYLRGAKLCVELAKTLRAHGKAIRAQIEDRKPRLRLVRR